MRWPDQAQNSITGSKSSITIDPDSWNRVRRKHYVLTMNDYMTMIAKAIKDKKIELAIDKLINSDISRLKKLIPRT